MTERYEARRIHHIISRIQRAAKDGVVDWLTIRHAFGPILYDEFGRWMRGKTSTPRGAFTRDMLMFLREGTTDE